MPRQAVNRWNPDPLLEVSWGRRSWDEMYQAFNEYTVESQDLTKLATIDDE